MTSMISATTMALAVCFDRQCDNVRCANGLLCFSDDDCGFDDDVDEDDPEVMIENQYFEAKGASLALSLAKRSSSQSERFFASRCLYLLLCDDFSLLRLAAHKCGSWFFVLTGRLCRRPLFLKRTNRCSTRHNRCCRGKQTRRHRLFSCSARHGGRQKQVGLQGAQTHLQALAGELCAPHCRSKLLFSHTTI